MKKLSILSLFCILIIIPLSFAYPSTNPLNAIEGWYFNETTGIVAENFVDSDNNASLIGATFSASGYDGYGVQFNADNEKVNLGENSLLSGKTKLTISAWVYPTNLACNDGACTIIGDRSGSDVDLWVTLFTDKTRIQWGATSYDSANTILPINTWTHISYVISPSEIKLYTNGELNETHSGLSLSPIGSIAGNYTAGTNGFANIYDFQGYMDNIILFDNNLSSSNIGDLFNNSFINDVTLVSPYTNSKHNTKQNFTYNVLNDKDNCSLYGNWSDTWKLNQTLDNINVSDNPNFFELDLLPDGVYTWNVECDNTNWGSENFTFIMDNAKPNIMFSPNNFFSRLNTTIIDKINISSNLTFNFTDNRDLFGFEINISYLNNGTTYFHNSTETLSGKLHLIEQYLNISTFPTGKYSAVISVSDSHTAYKINFYKVKTEEKKIVFDTDEGNHIEITSNVNSNVYYNKKLDRYSFRFDFKEDWLGNINTIKKFYLKANNPIRYIEHSNYTGHFVIWNKDTKKGNWVDFESSIKDAIVNKKWNIFDGDYYEIIFNTDVPFMEFNSIGGLNTNVLESQFNISSDYPENVKVYLGDEIQKSISGSFVSDTLISFDVDYISTLLDNKCTCNGCTVVSDNCRVPIYFSSENNGKLDVVLYNYTYEYGIDNCTIYQNPILNWTYYRTLTTVTNANDKINATFTYSNNTQDFIQWSYDIESMELCSATNRTNVTIDKQIQYTSDWTNGYVYTYNFNDLAISSESTTYLNLTIPELFLNFSSTTDIVVIDSTTEYYFDSTSQLISLSNLSEGKVSVIFNDGTQYFEFENNYTTFYDEEIEVITNQDTWVTLQVRDNAQTIFSEAIVNLYWLDDNNNETYLVSKLYDKREHKVKLQANKTYLARAFLEGYVQENNYRTFEPEELNGETLVLNMIEADTTNAISFTSNRDRYLTAETDTDIDIKITGQDTIDNIFLNWSFDGNNWWITRSYTSKEELTETIVFLTTNDNLTIYIEADDYNHEFYFEKRVRTIRYEDDFYTALLYSKLAFFIFFIVTISVSLAVYKKFNNYGIETAMVLSSMFCFLSLWMLIIAVPLILIKFAKKNVSDEL